MTGNSNYVAELQFGAPKIDEDAFVAPTAVVVGAVTLGSRASIWYGAIARADEEVIVIGPDSNIQDGCSLHSDPAPRCWSAAGSPWGTGSCCTGPGSTTTSSSAWAAS
ncbi:gamma carbonic anhydrase family protein [Blastococcus litoris]|uniref:gamma carbonic anhydrase family protein n=1 Tax=Blastococcus litoris TaxID=2171622 RepID=UPI001F1374E9|nr:hypothetical protein [Blastococcus litoris]